MRMRPKSKKLPKTGAQIPPRCQQRTWRSRTYGRNQPCLRNASPTKKSGLNTMKCWLILTDAAPEAIRSVKAANPFGNGFNGGGFRYERHEGEPFGAETSIWRSVSSFRQSHTRSEQPRGPIKGEDQHAELSIDIYAAYVGAERSMTWMCRL